MDTVRAGFPSSADDYADAWILLDEQVGIRVPGTCLVAMIDAAISNKGKQPRTHSAGA